MGIFEKIGLIIRSNTEDTLDRVIDMNSVGAVRQEVRDLEGKLEQLEGAEADARASQKGAERTRDSMLSRSQELEGQINAILTDDDPENDHLASALALQLVPIQERLTQAEADLATATQARDGVTQAVNQVRARHQSMIQQLDRLEVQDQTSKSKLAAANAVEAANKIAGSGGVVSVDNIQARMQHQQDVADARLEQAMAHTAPAQSQDVNAAKAAALLAQMKAKAKAAQPVTAT